MKRQALPYEPVCAIFRRYLHTEKLKFTPERAMMLDLVLRREGLFHPEQLVYDLKIVCFDGEISLKGELLDVEITDARNLTLFGRLAAAPSVV